MFLIFHQLTSILALPGTFCKQRLTSALPLLTSFLAHVPGI